MHSNHRVFFPLTLAAALALPTIAASVTGTVKGPDGAPFMGAFIVAENTQNKMTVNVLSDAQGRYHINNLPAATYKFGITSIGYKADPRNDVKLTADQKVSFDFALQKGVVRWSDLNTYQGTQLLPKTATHDVSKKYAEPFFVGCMISCHSFQHRMAENGRNQAGWKKAVLYMRDEIMGGEGGGRMTDEKVDDYAAFMAAMFGPESKKTASPADMPEYAALVRKFNPRAMNIAYVEYDFQPDKGQGPWSAVEDKDGMMWIPYYGRGNQVVKLNPKTAELTRFRLPFEETAGIHSAHPAPDGTVWFTEAAKGRLGQLDPKTGKITEFQNTPENGRRNGTHTVRPGQDGKIWSSGGPMISMLDTKTGKYQHWDVPGTYGVENGHNGDAWFTSFRDDGPIARVSRDGQLSKFFPPTKGKPQRLEIEDNGIVWFSERVGGKIGRFDPETEKFQEFQLPGPAPSPYALFIDKNKMIWYASHEQDTLNRLDPKTGDVIEYPFPHSEISMREMFMDSQGRIWYASSVNNKVGYWYINE